jgi:hypothetical protein
MLYYCLPTLEHTAKLNCLILLFFNVDYSSVNSIKMQLLFYNLLYFYIEKAVLKRDL